MRKLRLFFCLARNKFVSGCRYLFSSLTALVCDLPVSRSSLSHAPSVYFCVGFSASRAAETWSFLCFLSLPLNHHEFCVDVVGSSKVMTSSFSVLCCIFHISSLVAAIQWRDREREGRETSWTGEEKTGNETLLCAHVPSRMMRGCS